MAIVGHLWYSTPLATFLLDVNDLGAIVGGPPYADRWMLGKMAKPLWLATQRYLADGLPAGDRSTYAVWMSAVPDADA